MGKKNPIDSYFKRKNLKNSEAESSLHTPTIDTLISPTSPTPIVDHSISENRPTKTLRTEIREVDISSLERDPGLRPSIGDYNVNQRDEVRRAYIMAGPFQPILSNYPKSTFGKQMRSFQRSWFQYQSFSKWLEYLIDKDAAYCLPCYLFNKPSGNAGNDAFIAKGFRN